MSDPRVSAFALLPVRLFFGATFLWAGLDKLLDPRFLDPSSPASIHGQLAAFARTSPLGDLVTAALPFAEPIGVLIAVAELGVGIGALTGIAFRVAAAGGLLLSLLFWLTASWATHPYYFGADLPYAAGWLALVIAGHANLLVPNVARSRPSARPAPEVADPGRRVLLETGLLAVIATIVASVTAPLRAFGVASEPGARGPGGSDDEPQASPSSGPEPSGSGSPSASPDVAAAIARVADVQREGSVAFTVPFDAPAPLPAGDPGLVVELADHSFAAFDAICTHQGCTVQYDRVDAVIYCPCHGAEFDPAHDGAVLDGPTRTPLARLPLIVDTATGTIRLASS